MIGKTCGPGQPLFVVAGSSTLKVRSMEIESNTPSTDGYKIVYDGVLLVVLVVSVLGYRVASMRSSEERELRRQTCSPRVP